MKIIFLDLDGVLNSLTYFQELKRQGLTQDRIMDSLDPVMVERLNRIVEATNAKIVISSTWRNLHSMDELKAFLLKYAFKYNGHVIDVTPTLNKDRGYEIEWWLNEYHRGFDLGVEQELITSFVILDDNSDMVYDHLLSRLVLTTWENGMEEEHAQKAIEILGV